MAPLTRRQKKALAAAPPPPVTDPADPVIDPADCISNLPKDIQAHILSFLPAQEAVQTCVLARTWRDVWKSTRSLLITGDSVKEVRKFVDRLLRVRLDGLKGASLDASEIRFDLFDGVEDDLDANVDSEDMSSVNRWIRRVLKCQIQMLRIDMDIRRSSEAYMEMSNMPLLVSRHLTKLELTCVWFCCRCLNLDGCPTLEHLEIKECQLLSVRKIMSLSLKRLVITSCDSNCYEKCIQISVPHLVSLLWLDNVDVITLMLERMPELMWAKFQIGIYLDNCNCEDPMVYHVMGPGDHLNIGFDSNDEEGSGDYAGQNTTKCMVLEGLARAKDLELLADHETYIFRRDLRWCPTFSKLKTLVLNDDFWCQPADCSALACMLDHAPALEKLTVLFSSTVQTKYDMVLEGRPDATRKSTMISQHLKIVELKCFKVHQRVVNVLKFLGRHHIRFLF